ncbi:hypothetical protein C380_10870 [Acidovorax sp. KKS102]|uniref:DUF4136 domain-containing protein n=1 Tax=Acidovorax sp. KKS102 TaxID=358220 RepID=UPI00028AE6F3|nr:DUF4136 domain-containing protein [Acidovorax sp. KKS102]AFU45875.1 hypothetical protein C380_10870 [Acidovorax sp. KKS102]
MNKLVQVSVLGFAVVVAGCASLETDVRNYTTLPPKTADGYGSVFVYTSPEEKSSLAHAEYLRKVKAGFAKNGFKEGAPGNTDFVAFFHYDIEQSGVRANVSTPIYIGGNSAFAGGFNAAQAAGGSSVSTQTQCTRMFSMRLFRAHDFAAADRAKGERPTPVHELRAVSTGSTCDLGQVLPTLIDAAFENFPGENGRTVRVTKPL